MTSLADLSEQSQVAITSFGYGHGPASQADLTIDARRHLRNPHADPAIRYLTGLDPAVRYHVLTTPGARSVVRIAVTFATNLLVDTAAQQFRLVTIAVGCVGGRHRSVAMAEAVTAGLRAHSIAVEVEHRDIHRPVIQTQEGPR
jgi:UPF0042 nucleotide-binding protein